jgi:anaerobic magnesium-protoporphyrin IX monomethyl ester cyclase
MKILLINPPEFKKELRWDKGAATYPPLGLIYIAAVLEKEGFNVKILDGQLDHPTEEEFEARIKDEKPDVVGITSITPLHKEVLKAIDLVKKCDNNIQIVVGGPHSSLLKTKLMEMSENIDIIVKHEGEVTSIELIKAIEAKKDLNEIKGIIYRKDGKIIETVNREFILDLDNVPFPARHLLDMDNESYKSAFRYKRTPMTSVITSRGCPYNCLFCNRAVFGAKYRSNSPEYVIKELEYLKKEYGIKEVHFVDDTFLLDPKRVKAICDMMIEKKLDLTWSCNGRINIMYNNLDLIPLIKKAGCWYISFGVESGNKEVLKFLRKDITKEQAKEVIKKVSKAGIFTKGYFMLGNPTESKDTIEETIKFAKSLRLDAAQFNLVLPIPYTEFEKVCMEYGVFDSEDFDKMSGHSSDPVFVLDGMTKEYLKDIQKRAYKEFYGRPSYIFRQLLKIRDINSFKKYAERGYTYLFNKSS